MTGVCVVILTYADRVDYVNKVIQAVLQQGAAQVIIVSNGTTPAALKRINQSAQVQIHDLKENRGSSVGYKEGIKQALNTDCQIFFLLDDDNLPASDCLSILEKNWTEQLQYHQEDKLVLSCYREDQYDNGHLRIQGNRLSIQPFANSCHGFHIKTFFAALLKRFFKRTNYINLKDSEPGQVLELDGAFYGGMYFHRRMLDEVSLPEDQYFVYADDLDFSHRLVKQGGRIILVLGAILRSLDYSIPIQNRKKSLYHSTLDYDQSFRTYYCSRNMEYLTRKYFVTNKAIYYLNVFIFICVIGIVSILRGKMNRFKLIVLGKIDSWTGRMGKTTRPVGNT